MFNTAIITTPLTTTTTTSQSNLILSSSSSSSSLLSTTTSSLFTLSEPFKLNINYSNKDVSPSTINDLFEFELPKRLTTITSLPINTNTTNFVSNGGGKSTNLTTPARKILPTCGIEYTSIRNHPYNNMTSNKTVLNDTTPTQHQSKSASSHSSANSKSSSSNAILAQLKSISPNFKSIFVRPKNSKHIDSSSILNKTKLNSKNNDHHDDYVLPLLYNSSSSSAAATARSSSLLLNIEPPKELKLNASVDDLLKKFSTENDILSRTIKNISNNNYLNSGVIIKKQQQLLQQQQEQLDKINKAISGCNQPSDNLIVQLENSGSAGQSRTSSTIAVTNLSPPKWTCMICLTKHPQKCGICSVCGSAKSASNGSSGLISFKQSAASLSSTNASPLSNSSASSTTSSSSSSISPSSQLFTSYLLNELGYKHKLPSQQQQKSPSSPVSSTASSVLSSNTIDQQSRSITSNPYIKKWTCIHCNYSNDSLKIVCINCRWVKTSPIISAQSATIARSPSKTSLSDDQSETPIKRSKVDTHDHNNNVSTGLCSSCKSPLEKEKDNQSVKSNENTTASFLKPTSPSVATPTKSPAISASISGSFFSNKPETTLTTSATAPSLASLFTNNNKWNCDICLASNKDTDVKCACCSSPKPGAKKAAETEKPAQPAPATSLKSLLGASSNKWTCDGCLVSNDADKLACVCCQAPKPGSSKPTTSSGSLKSLLGASSSKWTCDGCLVSNDADKQACVCCQAPKPGAASANEKPSDKKTPFSLSTQPTLILPENITKSSSNPSIKFGVQSTSTENKESASAFPIKFGSSEIKFPTSTSLTFGAPSSSSTTISSTSTPSAAATSANNSAPKTDSLFKIPETPITTATTQPSFGSLFKASPISLGTTPSSTPASSPASTTLTNTSPAPTTGSSDNGIKFPSFGSSSTTAEATPFKFGSGSSTTLSSATSTSATSLSSTPASSQTPSLTPGFSFSKPIETTTPSTTTPALASSLFKESTSSTAFKFGSSTLTAFGSSSAAATTPAPTITITSETPKPFGTFNLNQSPFTKTTEEPKSIEINKTASSTTGFGTNSSSFFQLPSSSTTSTPNPLQTPNTNSFASSTSSQNSGFFSSLNTDSNKTLFGSTSSSTSNPLSMTSQSSASTTLFGNTSSTSTQENKSLSLFNNTSSTTSLPGFGSNTSTGGLFSFNKQSTTTSTTTTPSLPSSTPAPVPVSLFGQSASNTSTLSSLVTSTPASSFSSFNFKSSNPTPSSTGFQFSNQPSTNANTTFQSMIPSSNDSMSNGGIPPANKFSLTSSTSFSQPTPTPSFTQNFSQVPIINFSQPNNGVIEFSGSSGDASGGDLNARRYRRARRTLR